MSEKRSFIQALKYAHCNELSTYEIINKELMNKIGYICKDGQFIEEIQNESQLFLVDDENYMQSEDEDKSNNKHWDLLDAHLKEFACPKQSIKTERDYKNDDKIVQFPSNLHTIGCYYIRVPKSNKFKNKPIWWYKDHPERHVVKLVIEEQYTRLLLRKLINSGMLKNIDKVVSIGSESAILHANFNQPVKGLKSCAIKVFKTKLCESVSAGPYVKADVKFEQLFSNKNTRQVVRCWAKKEFDTLIEMEKIGINAPKPLCIKSHCVIMSFIGDDNPAPTLAELELPQEKWEYVYSIVTGAINKLYFEGGFVHGDLSAHNIMWWKNKCWFIDYSQMVSKDHINAMEYLRRDCKNITKLTKSESNILENAKTRERLLLLLKDHEKYSSEVKEHRSNTYELDFLLKQVQKEIKKLRTKGTEKPCDTLTNQTIVSQLENRLNTAMTKFNSVNSDNYKMRLHIDRLLCDRQFFNNVWKGQVRRLMEGKAQILELVEAAITTYEQREEWCSKLDALKEKAAVDYRRHCLEVRELQRQLEHSMKLEQFLRTKGTVRLTAADARAEAKRMELQEAEMRTYTNYVSILDAVKEYMNEDDVDKLTQEFTRREEENYALFNYINEVNTELKNLSDNVKSLRVSIEEEHAKHQAKLYKQQVSIESLRSTLEDKQNCRQKMQETCEKTRSVLEGLLHQVHMLASSSQCESLPLLRLLGQSLNINVTNARLFIKSLEKRITEIVEIIKFEEKFLESSSRAPAGAKRARAPRPPHTPRTPRRAAPRLA